MRRLLIVVFCVASMLVTAVGFRSVAADPSADPLADRYVIFLDGVRTSGDATKPLGGRFQNIEDMLRTNGFSHFAYFSYGALSTDATAAGRSWCLAWSNGCRNATGAGFDPLLNLDQEQVYPLYTEADTGRSVVDQAAVLDWMIDQIRGQRPTAQIDLVGFSLGGVIASYAAATYGRSDTWRQSVRHIVLIDSPVGGIPLANVVSQQSCSLEASCRGFRGLLLQFFDETIIRQLQMPIDDPTNTADNHPHTIQQGDAFATAQPRTVSAAPDSVVGVLPEAARLFKLTSIQSAADYLVNGLSFKMALSVYGEQEVVIGVGSQQWVNARHRLYNEVLSGSGILGSPISFERVYDFLKANHTQPLTEDNRVARWVLYALLDVDPDVDNAAIDTQSENLTVAPGERVQILFNIRNTGTSTWRREEGYGYRGTDLWAERTGLIWRTVAPTETITFEEVVNAPQEPGVYRYGLVLDHKGVEFGPNFFVEVTVKPSLNNDDFDGAHVIQLPDNGLPWGHLNSDTTGATSAPDDPPMGCGTGTNDHTLWFKVVPSFSGLVWTDARESDHRVVLAVFTGERGNLSLVTCTVAEGGGNEQSRLHFVVAANQTYYIEVAPYESAGGVLSLSMWRDIPVGTDATPVPTAILSPTAVTALLAPDTGPILSIKAPPPVQYSDSISFTVTMSNTSGSPADLTITADGLPFGLTLANNGDGTATIAGNVFAPAGTYSTTLTLTDAADRSTTAVVPLVVEREVVSLLYTGDTAPTAGSPFTLQAQVVEEQDGAPGDLARAAVVFDLTDRATGARISYGPVAASEAGIALLAIPEGAPTGSYNLTLRIDPASAYFQTVP